jgi:hypothetical protein
MARRRRHPTAWIFLLFLVLAVAGAATDHWQELMAGCSGILVMFSAWILFRNVVYCDVKRKNQPGFCERRIKGSLFGCQDHYWEKVVAWTRYLVTGYIARRIHVSLPTLRWQADPVQTPKTWPLSPITANGTTEMRQPPPGDAKKVEEYAPSIFMQATNFYVTFFRCVATIAGLGLSIEQVVK